MPAARRETREVALDDLAATQSLARRLAGVARAGDVLALRGGLGAGKTTFARAFIQARDTGGGVSEVPSPTFTLVQVYEPASGPIWHFDLYRLTAADQVWELGFEEALAVAVSLIEWPERIEALLPEDRLDLTLAVSGPEARTASLVGAGSWVDRLPDAVAHA